MSNTQENLAAAAAMHGFGEPIRFSEPEKLEDGVSIMAYHPRLPGLWLTVTRAPEDWPCTWRVRAWQIVCSPVVFAKDGEETIWGMPKLGSTEYTGNSGKTLEEAIEFAKKAAKGELDQRYNFFAEDWFKAKRMRRNGREDSQPKEKSQPSAGGSSTPPAGDLRNEAEHVEWPAFQEVKNVIVAAVALSKWQNANNIPHMPAPLEGQTFAHGAAREVWSETDASHVLQLSAQDIIR